MRKVPVTSEVTEVPGHLMIGGTYRADYHPETGTFTPALNTEAHLNVTYNYGRYYSEVYEEGTRKIYGMSGVDSIPILENMISGITKKYKKGDAWISSKVSEGDTSNYWLATAANAMKPLYQLIALAKMRPQCIWDGD